MPKKQSPKRNPVFEVYPSADGFRWRLISRNHKIVADSAEAYANKSNAKRAAKSLAKATVGATVVVAEK